jgi:hypothetical protein
MQIVCNGVASWLCNVCGHVWPERAAYLNDGPLQCARCRTRVWNDPLPDDETSELCGA